MKKSYTYPVYLFSFALCLLLSGCEEHFEVNIPEGIAEGIVFKGTISNEDPPYFVQLNKPAPLSAPNNMYEGIKDALVVITDLTDGIKDTLQYLEPNLGEFRVSYSYYNYHLQKEEGVSPLDISDQGLAQGIYVTTKIYGIEGHTYLLDIIYKGVHHTAQETMLPKTPITDIKLLTVDLGEKGETHAPCISFVNPPDEENYYMFEVFRHSIDIHSISNLYGLLTHPEYWEYSILSDEHLEENVVDYIVGDGENSTGRPPGSYYPSGNYPIHVFTESISKDCYLFYEQVIKQFRNDGGAFSPRPTNTKGNISGNVWGYFRVCSQAHKSIDPVKHEGKR